MSVPVWGLALALLLAGASAAAQRADPAAAVEEPAKPRHALGLAPFASIGGGLSGHEGIHINHGGGIGLEWPPGAALFGRFWLALAEGPEGVIRDGNAVGISIAPGLLLGYRWRIAVVSLGPLVGVSAPWKAVTLVIGDSGREKHNWWDCRGVAGIEIQVAFGDELGLFVDWLAGVHAVRRTFLRRSDGSTIFATPLVDWDVLVGLVAYLG